MVLFEGHGSPCGGFCVAIPGAGVAMTLFLDSFLRVTGLFFVNFSFSRGLFGDNWLLLSVLMLFL